MRTTLTLDADLHRFLQDTAHCAEPFAQPVFSLGRPQVDLTKAMALANELEDRECATRIRLA